MGIYSMKFLESHFEEYTNEVKRLNLHPKLEKCYNRFPEPGTLLKLALMLI